MAKDKIDLGILGNQIAVHQEALSELTDQIGEWVDGRSVGESSIEEVEAVSRHLLLMARDATAAGVRLLLALRLLKSEKAIKKVSP